MRKKAVGGARSKQVRLDAAASERLTAAIRAGDIDPIVAFLQSGTHHGKPGAPAAVKLGVIGLFHQNAEPDALEAWADRLCASDAPIARSVACGLVAPGWRRAPARTRERMHALACDADWEVREWAADLFGGVLAIDFEGALALYRRWCEADEPAPAAEALRRAVAVGMGNRTKVGLAAETAPMLALMELLMSKPGDYLQKNLGPFALGGAFLSRFPEPTLLLCERSADSDDQATCWNVAMAFSSAAARKHRLRGERILARIDAGGSKRVERAIQKARRNLARG